MLARRGLRGRYTPYRYCAQAVHIDAYARILLITLSEHQNFQLCRRSFGKLYVSKLRRGFYSVCEANCSLLATSNLFSLPPAITSLSINMAHLDIEHAHSQFPSLKSGFIFADNAGGSQVTQGVIDKFTDYLVNTNVQLGAGYSLSAQATSRAMVDAPLEAAKLFNAKSPKEIVFGPSSTANLENLARGLEKSIEKGDEFIVVNEHEGSSTANGECNWLHLLIKSFEFQPMSARGRASLPGQALGSNIGSTQHPTLTIPTLSYYSSRTSCLSLLPAPALSPSRHALISSAA